MTIFFKVLLLGAFASFLVTSGASAAGAATGLRITPAIAEEILEPGQTKQLTITINNTTPAALPISASTGSLVLQDKVIKEDEQAQFDASAWITIPERRFILEPGKSREVTVQITAPKNAEPGGHYAMVFFEPAIAFTPPTQSAVYQNMRVATTLLLQIPGDIHYGARLVAPASTRPWHETGPVTFTFALHNTGNVHFVPTGSLVIRDFQGKVIERVALPVGIVLPGTAKQYSLTWSKRFPVGLFTATVELEYGPNHISLVRTPTTFIVAPGISFIVLLAILAIIVPFIVRSRHRIVLALQALFKSSK